MQLSLAKDIYMPDYESEKGNLHSPSQFIPLHV